LEIYISGSGHATHMGKISILAAPLRRCHIDELL
jgi:hypothetical protein